MTTQEIKKALNTEFRLDTVKRLIEQINADNYSSYSSLLELKVLKSKLYDLVIKCENSESIELVVKRQNSVSNALRKLNN